MSQEEQDAALGKLMREKMEAQKQFTLLLLEIKRQAAVIESVGRTLGSIGMPEAEQQGTVLLEEAIAAGGLSKIKSDLEKFTSLRPRVLELTAKAKELGFE